MIYRILVDNRRHVAQVDPTYTVTGHTLRALSGSAEPDLSARLAPLKDKVFPDYESFIQVLSKILGPTRLAQHRTRIVMLASHYFSDDVRMAIPWHDEKDRRLGGPGYGWLADVMQAQGLRRPLTTNPRLRYYFTELGWRKVGRHVAAEARRLGHLIKVVRRKNPSASQIAYRDAFQIAILQNREPSRNADGAMR